MKKIIVDTNVFLRFILNDNRSQAVKAEKLFNQASEAKIILIVPQIVIFEIEFTLSKYYKFKREQIADKLRIILSANFLKLGEKELFSEALKHYQKYSLSFVDCFIIQKAERERAEIFTFDKKLSKVSK